MQVYWMSATEYIRQNYVLFGFCFLFLILALIIVGVNLDLNKLGDL